MNNNTLDGVKMLHHDEMRNYDRIQGKIISVIMNHAVRLLKRPASKITMCTDTSFLSSASKWSRPSIPTAGSWSCGLM